MFVDTDAAVTKTRQAHAMVNGTRRGRDASARVRRPGTVDGSLNEQGEVADVERAGVARRRRVRPVRHLVRQVGPRGDERTRPDGGHERRSRQLVVDRRTPAKDDINGGEKNSVGVVVRQRLGLWRRLRIRLGSVVPIVVVMVVAARAVMMVSVGTEYLIVVAKGRGWVRVKMRTEVVSGGLTAAVRVADGGRLGQQHARQQQQGHDASVHNPLVGTDPHPG